MVQPSERSEPLATERLLLEPLRAAHAIEMVAVLDDPELHRYVVGEPLRLENGVTGITAHIHPDNLASKRVARAIGLGPTEEIARGEVVWKGSNPIT